MASLSLQGIQKIYPNGFHAVKDFNLEIAMTFLPLMEHFDSKCFRQHSDSFSI